MSKLRDALDKLATDIHNMSPGDVGSMDRVLIVIARAEKEIEATAIAEARQDGFDQAMLQAGDVWVKSFIDCGLPASASMIRKAVEEYRNNRGI
jgi:hypothetical protein